MSHPLEGKLAPDVTLLDQHGREFSLAAQRGKAVLLVFVPFAFSDVCTNELVDLRDASELHRRDDLTVAVISCDSVYTVKAWADTHAYRSPLLSDFWPHGAAAQAYGVFNAAEGLAIRGSFLIDAGGVVRWTVVNPTGQARDVADYHVAIADL